jgi:hypothetical protein
MGRSKRTGPGLEQQACSILDLRSLILLTEAHTTRVQFNRKSAFSRQSKIPTLGHIDGRIGVPVQNRRSGSGFVD